MNNEILYVDDEYLNLELFEYNLKNEFKIHIAANGIKALEILEQNKGIRVVISDMKMPFMSGVEFVRKAKSKSPHLICYILTGYGINKEIQEAQDSKLINQFFSKPLDFNKIKLAIKKEIEEI